MFVVGSNSYYGIADLGNNLFYIGKFLHYILIFALLLNFRLLHWMVLFYANISFFFKGIFKDVKQQSQRKIILNCLIVEKYGLYIVILPIICAIVDDMTSLSPINGNAFCIVVLLIMALMMICISSFVLQQLYLFLSQLSLYLKNDNLTIFQRQPIVNRFILGWKELLYFSLFLHLLVYLRVFFLHHGSI